MEASPVDRVWGIGLTVNSNRAENPKHWNGLNLLGFALMEVRDFIKKENVSNVRLSELKKSNN